MSWSPDGHCIAARNFREIWVWEVQSGKVLQRKLSTRFNWGQMDWIPRSAILVYSKGDRVFRWNAEGLREENVLIEGWHTPTGTFENPYDAISLSCDGRRLAMARKTSVRIHDAASGRLLKELRGQTYQVRSLAWSPDGKRLASLCGLTTLKVWDTHTAGDLFTLSTGDPKLAMLAWSPDGRQVIAYGSDNLRVWDASSGYQESEPATCRRHQAERLLDSDRIDEAIDLLERSEAERGSRSDYRPFLAEQLALRRHARAEDILKSLLAETPGNLTYQEQWAEYLGNTDRPSQAIAILEPLIPKLAKPADGWRKLSRLHGQWAAMLAAEGHQDEALAEFTGAIESLTSALAGAPQADRSSTLREDFAAVYCNRGYYYYQLSDARWRGRTYYEKAVDDLSKSIEYAPNFFLPYHHRGAAYGRINQLDRAMSDYNRALELNPKDRNVYILRGSLYVYQEQWQLALRDLDEAVRLGSKSKTLLSRRAEAHEALGNLAQAAADLTEVIRMGPESTSALIARAEVHRKRGDFQGAVADLSEAARRDPENTLVLTKRSEVHQKLGNLEQALGNLEQALVDRDALLRLKPNDAAILFSRAALCLELGRTDEAQRDMATLEKLNPPDPGGKNNLAWNLAAFPDRRMHRPKRAVELAEAAVQAQPKDGNYWNTLGAARYRAGDWKGTLDAFQKSCDLRSGGDACDWLFMAMAHWRLGEKDAARQWYDKGIQGMKGKPESEELLRFRDEAAELLGVKETGSGE